jgi:hypothetical protein
VQLLFHQLAWPLLLEPPALLLAARGTPLLLPPQLLQVQLPAGLPRLELLAQQLSLPAVQPQHLQTLAQQQVPPPLPLLLRLSACSPVLLLPG